MGGRDCLWWRWENTISGGGQEKGERLGGVSIGNGAERAAFTERKH